MLPDKTSAAVAKYTVAGRRERHKPASWIVKPGIDWFISIHPTSPFYMPFGEELWGGLCQIVIERLLWSIILNFRLQQHNSMSILFDSSVVTFFSSKPVDTQRSGILDLVRIRIKVPIDQEKVLILVSRTRKRKILTYSDHFSVILRAKDKIVWSHVSISIFVKKI